MKYNASDAVDFTDWKGIGFDVASDFSGMHEVRCVFAEYFDYSWRLKAPNSIYHSNSHNINEPRIHVELWESNLPWD